MRFPLIALAAILLLLPPRLGAPMQSRSHASARHQNLQTRLFQAAGRGDLPTLKTLLDQGASITARDAHGLTLLMALDGTRTVADYERIFRFLQSRGADINAQDRYGQTLLLRTINAGPSNPPPTLRFLLERGADPRIGDREGNTALMYLSWWTQYDMIMLGREEKNAETIKLLVKHGVDVDAHNKEGMTALMYAAGWRHAPALEALFACGAQVDLRDSRGRTALTWAARNGRRSKTVQLLLQANAHIGPTEALLLHDFPQAEALLSAGGDLSVPGPFGESLLMIAAEQGQSALVETLLARGMAVNARDSQGMSALMLAVAGRSSRSLGLGHKAWASPDPSDAKTRIVQALLAHHADPNLQNREKETALQIAQEVQNTPLADLLTRYGAKLPDAP